MPVIEVTFYRVACDHPGCHACDITDDYSAWEDPDQAGDVAKNQERRRLAQDRPRPVGPVLLRTAHPLVGRLRRAATGRRPHRDRGGALVLRAGLMLDASGVPNPGLTSSLQRQRQRPGLNPMRSLDRCAASSAPIAASARCQAWPGDPAGAVSASSGCASRRPLAVDAPNTAARAPTP